MGVQKIYFVIIGGDVDIKTISNKLFDYPAGNLCGVLIDEKTMKRLAKLTYKYEQDVRKILTEEKDNLYSSHWTLANEMDGEKIKRQVTITYVDDKSRLDVQRRIDLFKAPQPIYKDEVFVCTSHKEATKVAEMKLRGEI